MPTSPDRCPKWADELITRLFKIEVGLGNLRPKGEQKAFAEKPLKSLAELEDLADQQSAAEALFQKIAKGLTDEGFTPEQIAAFVNARVNDGFSKLPYCNAAEVTEAL